MVLAGITLFQPEWERLRQNIRAVMPQVDLVVCIDNGSDKIEEIEQQLHGEFPGVELIKNGRNLGVAKALNQMFELAGERCLDWVLTLDQDSVCPGNLMEEYRKYVHMDKIAALCPVLIDRNCGLIRETPEQDGNPVEGEGGDVKGTVFVEKCITSASLNRVEAWKLAGGFFEELFIDFVDHDYCARLREMGYRILQVSSVELLHEMGHAVSHHFLGTKITALNHSSFRRYYITRNWIYYMWRHRQQIHYREEKAKYYFSFIKVLLYENHKAKKLRTMLRGARDGHRWVRRLKAERK